MAGGAIFMALLLSLPSSAPFYYLLQRGGMRGAVSTTTKIDNYSYAETGIFRLT